ncbi:DUF3313 family protein [Oceanicoccus sp. KOV_DT_Chl]|uniref:DUF3313 family protein n=1 Tax=Oceanicoccus sp. KOV_DT_Chl TaxID=1904639 RepID=UPI000C7B0D59|nr:DUF3313 family protein [Oceanicoccus sp. KOV_DT_Chl]
MKSIAFITGLLLCMTFSACNSPNPEFGSPTAQGLTPVTNSSFDQLLIRANIDFNRYRRINIEPLSISYKKRSAADLSFYREQDFQFDEAERKIFNEQFVKAVSKQWQQQFGWQLTTETGDDVLLVKTDISDLYLTASIKNDKPLRQTTVVNESSSMTIKLQLFDNSGQILLDSVGEKTTGQRGSGVSTMTRVSSVRYWSDCLQAFRQVATLIGNQIETSP